MLMKYFLPSPVLREYVKLLQLVHWEVAENMVVPCKPYWPRPEQCLTFNPRSVETIELANGKLITKPKTGLIGQPSVVTNRFPPPNFLLFQVVFQPGALFRLTGIASHELTNTLIDAEAVFSKEIRLVNERLSGTNNYDEMTEIVENFLLNLINKRNSRHSQKDLLPIDKVSQLMLNAAQFGNSANLSMDWLAHEACLSTKQFYRKFIERMGISPKTYARIVRFDNAMKLKNTQPNKDWLSIALDWGYYDYQHLVKDFKEFTHLTPTEFMQKDNKGPERTFGLREDF